MVIYTVMGKRSEFGRIDKDFYLHCSKKAQDNYNNFFSEKVFINHMNKIL